MARPCTIKHLLVDHADPNEIAIEYIHASSMRLIAQFVHSPSAQGAHAIAVILDALAKHDDALVSPCGHSVYKQAANIWRNLAEAHAQDELSVTPEIRIH